MLVSITINWPRMRAPRSHRTFDIMLIVVFLALVIPTALGFASDDATMTEVADKILKDRHCPCGCGNYLPGNEKEPACFGCSVGKAEISRVWEALAVGRSAVDIVIELNETVLIDVFADYTNPELFEIWEQTVRAAGDAHQHRVVLRTPGRSEDARRAIKLAECARAEGKFTQVQRALMRHRGPWDQETLVDLAAEQGMKSETVRKCLGQTDISAQVAKDKEHAKRFGVQQTPAVSVNRRVIPSTAEDLRQAIRKILEDEMI